MSLQVAAGFYHTIVLTGGDDDEGAEMGSCDTVHNLSHSAVLGRPALALPQDTRDDVGVEHTQCSREEGHDSRAATPEMSSPKHERIGTAMCSRGASEVRLGEMKSALKRNICLEDGRVDCRKAAVFIMAHMDRLAETFSIRDGKGIPAIGNTTANMNDSDPSCLDGDRVGGGADGESDEKYHSIYCIDLCPETFELLSSILSFGQEDDNLDDSDDIDEIPLRSYIVLAALRILKANLTRFLESSLSSRVLAGMMDHSVHADLDDANEVRLDGLLGHDSSSDTVIFQVPGEDKGKTSVDKCDAAPCAGSSISDNVGGNGHEQDRTGSANGDPFDEVQSIKRYGDVLRALQRRLLLLVHCGPSRSGHAGVVEHVQREAATVIILGLELFFCSQVDQFRVLSTLMNTSEVSDDDEVDSDGADCDSVGRPLVLGPSAARRHILAPLLGRLCDDDVASKLIPYGSDEENGCSVCTAVEVSEPRLSEYRVPGASPRLLDMQVSWSVSTLLQLRS